MESLAARQVEPSPATPTTALLDGPLGRVLWRGCELARGQADDSVSSGFAALDAALPGGGWPLRALSEILQPSPGLCEWRLLGPALGPLLENRQRHSLLLINPPFTPHLPGLAAWGLSAAQIVWLAPSTPQQTLWTLEQALKANAAAALLAWLPPGIRPEQLRRLQACALGHHAPCFVFRPSTAAGQSSAAPLRLALAPQGRFELRIDLLKRRGPALEQALLLQAAPPALADRLPARLLRPAAAWPPAPAPVLPQELRDALARPARLARLDT